MFFLFKQKTAYEVRMSDWSSDVCSSDLLRVRLSEAGRERLRLGQQGLVAVQRNVPAGGAGHTLGTERLGGGVAQPGGAERRHPRSEERRVGKAGVITVTSPQSPYTSKKQRSKS